MDPTARGDMIAERMRTYYEAHRESWWKRRFRRWEYTSDCLMLGLMAVYQEASRELRDRPGAAVDTKALYDEDAFAMDQRLGD